ncbi:gliding motility-associated-like protein [Jejuia pallidilutea]|uniref:Gliding motility-associated-like protein n=1 Tax=Jejuia pallidilutea TaxID=504487 RepID=A0A362X0M6_9FLAO|nr:T9SS type B sorting domain-containing protein [Jejuia pallidilutea]PQV49454.1 gliding motility-associated-like protein [Jejuia pallidilutea]
MAIKKIIFITFSFTFICNVNAQIDFCTGIFGDPIFTEDFGNGTNDESLPSGNTTYIFATGTPNDGAYKVSSNTNYFDWFDTEDHTPNDTNGRMLIVNADTNPGEFFKMEISGLCENTIYGFSTWIINLKPFNLAGCGGNGVGIPINIRFEIWDSTDTNLLASGNTGNILNTLTPEWLEYGLVFKSLPEQTSVILKMINNEAGGCGNDFAIDDIWFRSCGDSVPIVDSQNNTAFFMCEGDTPYSTTLRAIPDSSIFSEHFYQWQESRDGVNWVDIPGETRDTFVTPILTNQVFYRTKVVENLTNLLNSSCNTLSDVFEFGIARTPVAPVINRNLSLCDNALEPLEVKVANGVTVNWYDAPTGGNLILANSTSFNANVTGTYYAEAVNVRGGCRSVSRTAIQFRSFETPIVTDETLEICENSSVTLNANTNIPTATYRWNTGQVSERITVSLPGTYTVDVTNIGCTVTKTIEVIQVDNPIVDNIQSNGNSIIVNLSNSGNYLYALDGSTFQPNNTFLNLRGGEYTIYVKHQDCDEVVTAKYIHFYIPKFFTPNNDGVNDWFDLKGIELFSTSSVSIFNRYGKLLKSSKNAAFSWDGTFKGQQLPSDDYWYVITINEQKLTGHFTLKR